VRENVLDSAPGSRREEALPDEHGKCAPLTGRVPAFWVALEGGYWVSPLAVLLPDGTEAIALFCGEEEASMFCRFRDEDEWAISTIRRTTAGGVLSMLDCHWLAKHVVLDPLPGFLGERSLGQLALERERFARRFAGVEPGTVAG